MLRRAATCPLPILKSGFVPGPLPIDDTGHDYADDSEEGDKARTAEQLKVFQEEEKLRLAQDEMLGKEQADAVRQEEKERAEHEKTLLGAAEKFLASGKATAQGASLKIGNLPTPGSIIVPLAFLALFFFILLTFNGNTRMQWLWLVLTNNAYITPSQTNLSPGGTGGGPPNPVQETNVQMLAIPIAPRVSSNGMYGSAYS